MLSEEESREMPEETTEATKGLSKVSTKELSEITSEVAETPQEVADRLKSIELRLTGIEKSIERIEKSIVRRLEDSGIKSLAGELRNAVSGIEAVTRDLKYRFEKVTLPTEAQPAEQAQNGNANSPSGEMSIRRIMAENWLQIALGMIIALIAITITVYLFSRAPR